MTCPGLRWRELHALYPDLSYRQVDYWTRSGRVAVHQHTKHGFNGDLGETITDPDKFGSGYVNCWLPDAVRKIGHYSQLAKYDGRSGQLAAIVNDRQAVLQLLAALTKIDADLQEVT